MTSAPPIFAARCIGARAMPRAGWAQSYPSRTITLVVFTPPGGAPDIVGG